MSSTASLHTCALPTFYDNADALSSKIRSRGAPHFSAPGGCLSSAASVAAGLGAGLLLRPVSAPVFGCGRSRPQSSVAAGLGPQSSVAAGLGASLRLRPVSAPVCRGWTVPLCSAVSDRLQCRATRDVQRPSSSRPRAPQSAGADTGPNTSGCGNLTRTPGLERRANLQFARQRSRRSVASTPARLRAPSRQVADVPTHTPALRAGGELQVRPT